MVKRMSVLGSSEAYPMSVRCRCCELNVTQVGDIPDLGYLARVWRIRLPPLGPGSNRTQPYKYTSRGSPAAKQGTYQPAEVWSRRGGLVMFELAHGSSSDPSLSTELSGDSA